MNDDHTNWILDSVTRWLRDPAESLPCPPDLDPTRLGDILEKNRLLQFFQTLRVDYPANLKWERFQDRLSLAYQRSLIQGLQQLQSGRYLMDCLLKGGIKSLAVRGPFLAEDVYGDSAARLSSDIDILVPYGDRRRAWQCCQKAGYRSLEWACPLWPVDKHRIHWRIQREGDPVVCELHWAVEPVYGVMTLDYEALLRNPSPSSLFLLLCLHAGEHVADVHKVQDAGMITAESAMREGMLFRWLDVALFLRKYGAQIDWEWIDRHVRDRRIGESLVLCMNGVRDWFGMSLPETADLLLPAWLDSASRQRSKGWRRRLELWWERRRAGHAMGLETPFADVLYFLVPHASFFAPSHGISLIMRRVGHGLQAFSVLSKELLSYACFAMITSARHFWRTKIAESGGHS